MKSKSGKLFEIRDIEEKLEKIERNERKLEALCTRVDHLENLNSRCNNNNNGELQAVKTEESSDVVRSQKIEVNIYLDIFNNLEFIIAVTNI